MTHHPDEVLLTRYVDDALEGAPRNELEAHLVGCRECRARIVALRDESAFLGDVLHERERLKHVREPVPQTEADVAVGLPMAIAAATVVFGVVSALLESRIPGGLDLFNPLRLKGAYEMVFDFVFFVRDAAPGIIELLVSLGAVVSVSALLSFGVGLLYRRLFDVAAGVLLALLLLPGAPANATRVIVDEEVHIARGEVVEESMVLTGDRGRIDGTVKGDVVAMVEHLQITGRIEGNLYVFSRDLDLTGSVGGTLHTVSQRGRVDGRVEGSCMAVSALFTVTAEGRCERDAWLLLAAGILDGSFGQDVLLGGRDIELGGEVEGNLDVRLVEETTIRSSARIAGDVDVWQGEDDVFELDPGAAVAGEVRLHEGGDPVRTSLVDRIRPRLLVAHAIAFAASLIFGLLLYALLPGIFDVGIRTSRDFFRNLLMGLVLLVVPPFAIAATGLTLVGLPIAVLASFVYITCLYGAELLVAMWVGRTLLGHEAEASLWSFGRVFFVGVAIVFVLAHLPFVGKPIALLSLLTGLGLVFERARRLPIFAR